MTQDEALDTPVLIVDLDVMEANIARIAQTCAGHGVGWRPHFKGHKTIEIAAKQLAAGAIGITCAKLGEAEVLADAGISGILIANQIVGALKLERLRALRQRSDVIVAVDSVSNVRALAAIPLEPGVRLSVVIEVNIGMNRAGVEPAAPVVALADEIAAHPGLMLAGVLGWEAQTTAIADPVAKAQAVAAAIALLTTSADLCRDAGHAIGIVSCGGTGTFPFCIQQPGVTEVQVGGATFNDEHYRTHYGIDFPCALTIAATVTSRPTPTRIIVDAGRKAMSFDAASPRALIDGVRELKLSAEHTTLELDVPSATPAIGDVIRFAVGYSDTTVHLHQQIAALRGGRLEGVWPVAARGRIK